MGLLLGIIIPTLVVLSPFIVLLLIAWKKKNMRKPIFVIGLISSFLLGLIVPIIATFLSTKGLAYNFGPDDPRCLTGATVFVFFGYLINLVGLPISILALSLSGRTTKAKV
jgi:hypothetical protein